MITILNLPARHLPGKTEQINSQDGLRHINGKKLSSVCIMIRKLSYIPNLQTIKMIYFAHFHSLSSYGIIFWGSSALLNNVFPIPNLFMVHATILIVIIFFMLLASSKHKLLMHFICFYMVLLISIINIFIFSRYTLLNFAIFMLLATTYSKYHIIKVL